MSVVQTGRVIVRKHKEAIGITVSEENLGREGLLSVREARCLREAVDMMIKDLEAPKPRTRVRTRSRV